MRKHRTVQIIGIVIIAAAFVYLVLGLIGAISLSNTGLGDGWSTGWRGWVTIPVLVATILGFAALLTFGALLFFLAKIDTNLSLAQQQMADAAAKPAAPVVPVAATAAVAGVVAAERREAPVEVAAPAVETPAVEAPVIETPALTAAAVAGVVAAGDVAAERHADAAEVVAPVVEAPAIAGAVGAEVAESLPEIESEAQAPSASLPAAEATAPQVTAGPTPADAPVDAEAEALRAQLAALQAQIAGLDADQSSATEGEGGTSSRLPGTEEAARIAAEMAALKPPKP